MNNQDDDQRANMEEYLIKSIKQIREQKKELKSQNAKLSWRLRRYKVMLVDLKQHQLDWD